MTNSLSLPGNQVLGKNEKIVHQERFVSSLLTFYIRSTMVSTNKRLLYHYPNIALWLIPMGFENTTFNLGQISSVNLEVKYQLIRVILGVAVGIPTLLLLGIGIIPLLWGLTGIKTYVIVGTSGGKTKWSVIFWERKKARKFISDINLQLAELEEPSDKKA